MIWFAFGPGFLAQAGQSPLSWGSPFIAIGAYPPPAKPQGLSWSGLIPKP
jgi:hypothetical protein